VLVGKHDTIMYYNQCTHFLNSVPITIVGVEDNCFSIIGGLIIFSVLT